MHPSSSGAMEAALVTAASRFMFQQVTDLLQLDKKLKEMMGTETKMEKLKELSTIIDAVIEDVESHPSIGDAVKDLLKKLKYLSYDLEDVVDYYDTKVFQKKQRLSPVRDFFSSDNQLVFNIRVGGMIKAITESLDSILLQKSILLNLPQGNIRMPEPSLYNRETHSRNSFVVIGREPEKNKIVHMLTQEDDDDDDESINHGTLKVIAIVGMGGLGKTTLAQLVFNDKKVKDHFASSRMWTVVGVEFDPANIMKSVLELATDAPVNISQIDLVRQRLEKALSRKKFLLVLDDVWNENESKWNVLKAALSTCGARGSKILVTTRSQQVSSIMGSFFNTTHRIQQLSGDDCLSLFQQYAFRDQVVDQNLMEIGRKIVEKCGGVPLAAISLGSMLRSTREETYWSSVLKSEIWQLGNEEQKVLAVLKLSYDTLPPRSKKCFAFASLFPKNTKIAKDALINLWIANGFVRSEGNFDAETNGNHVFNDLVMGSFFLLSLSRDVDSNGNHVFAPFAEKKIQVDDSHVTKCTMHDLMHDLARSVSTDVYWNSDKDSVEDIGKRIYHMQIHSRKFPNMTQVVLGKKSLSLRTFITHGSCLGINQLEVFSKLKFLRALDLTACCIREVPMSIGNLILLRYLDLSKNDIEVLPDSITLLSNLQYLDLSSNYKLQDLPKDLENMQSLRDLNFRNYGFLDIIRHHIRWTHIPSGLSRLTNLRSLRCFTVGDRTGACSILELEDLKLGGEMDIIFSKNFKNYSCGGRKILKNKNLNELCIIFNSSERYDKDMLDDLCPNTNLKKLSIWHYGSPQFPTWLIELQLPNLVEVSLCCDCNHIPPFGNLRLLKKLDLWFMYGITQMGVEFHGYGGFPSLQELSLSGMANLEEWSESHGVNELFPKLQRLNIFLCSKLKSMPRLPRIQYLEVSACSGSTLSCIRGLTSLSVLEVKNMDDITSLPNGCIKNLTSLTALRIKNCGQLQSLPGDEMQSLEMLRSLTIERCESLAAFPSEVGHLSSLSFLLIQDCSRLERVPWALKNRLLENLQIINCPQLIRRYKSETGEDWPIISHGPNLYEVLASSRI